MQLLSIETDRIMMKKLKCGRFGEICVYSFEIGGKMLTLSSMENLIVPCNLKGN